MPYFCTRRKALRAAYLLHMDAAMGGRANSANADAPDLAVLKLTLPHRRQCNKGALGLHDIQPWMCCVCPPPGSNKVPN